MTEPLNVPTETSRRKNSRLSQLSITPATPNAASATTVPTSPSTTSPPTLTSSGSSHGVNELMSMVSTLREQLSNLQNGRANGHSASSSIASTSASQLASPSSASEFGSTFPSTGVDVGVQAPALNQDSDILHVFQRAWFISTRLDDDSPTHDLDALDATPTALLSRWDLLARVGDFETHHQQMVNEIERLKTQNKEYVAQIANLESSLRSLQSILEAKPTSRPSSRKGTLTPTSSSALASLASNANAAAAAAASSSTATTNSLNSSTDSSTPSLPSPTNAQLSPTNVIASPLPLLDPSTSTSPTDSVLIRSLTNLTQERDALTEKLTSKIKEITTLSTRFEEIQSSCQQLVADKAKSEERIESLLKERAQMEAHTLEVKDLLRAKCDAYDKLGDELDVLKKLYGVNVQNPVDATKVRSMSDFGVSSPRKNLNSTFDHPKNNSAPDSLAELQDQLSHSHAALHKLQQEHEEVTASNEALLRLSEMDQLAYEKLKQDHDQLVETVKQLQTDLDASRDVAHTEGDRGGESREDELITLPRLAAEREEDHRKICELEGELVKERAKVRLATEERMSEHTQLLELNHSHQTEIEALQKQLLESSLFIQRQRDEVQAARMLSTSTSSELQARVFQQERELQELKDQLAQMKATSQSSAESVSTMQQERDQLQITLNQLTEQNDTLTQQLRKQSTELEQLQSNYQLSQEELTSLQLTNDALSKDAAAELATLQANYQSCQASLATCEFQLKAVTQELRDNFALRDQHKQDMADVTLELESLKIKHQATQDSLVESQCTIETLTQEVARLTQQQTTLTNDLTETTTELDNLKSKHRTTEDSLVTSQVELDQATTNLNELTAQHTKLQQDLTTTTSELESLQTKYKTNQDSLVESQLALDAAIHERDTHQKQLTDLKHQLAHVRNELTSQTTELDTTKSRLKTAQDQLVEHQLTADKATQEQHHQKGNVTELYHRNVSLQSQLADQTTELDNLRARYKATQDSLVESQLANETVTLELEKQQLLVKDLQLQVETLTQQLQEQTTQVTQLEVKYQSGQSSLTANQAAIEQELTTERVAVQELRTKLDSEQQVNSELQEQLGTSTKQLNEGQLLLDQAHSSLKELQGQIESLMAQLAQQQTSLVEASDRNSTLQSQLTDQTSELDNLRARYQATQDSLVDGQVANETATKEVEKQQELVSDLQKQVAALTQQLQEQTTQLDESQAKYQSSQDALSGIQTSKTRELEVERAAVQELRLKLESLTTQSTRYQAELDSEKQVNKELQEQLEASTKQLNEGQLLLDQTHQSLEELTQQITSLKATETEHQHSLIESSKRNVVLESELTQRTAELDALRSAQTRFMENVQQEQTTKLISELHQQIATLNKQSQDVTSELDQVRLKYQSAQDQLAATQLNLSAVTQELSVERARVEELKISSSVEARIAAQQLAVALQGEQQINKDLQAHLDASTMQLHETQLLLDQARQSLAELTQQVSSLTSPIAATTPIPPHVPAPLTVAESELPSDVDELFYQIEKSVNDLNQESELLTRKLSEPEDPLGHEPGEVNPTEVDVETPKTPSTPISSNFKYPIHSPSSSTTSSTSISNSSTNPQRSNSITSSIPSSLRKLANKLLPVRALPSPSAASNSPANARPINGGFQTPQQPQRPTSGQGARPHTTGKPIAPGPLVFGRPKSPPLHVVWHD